MSTASISGVAVSHARVQVPGWGLWWSDAVTVEEVDLAVGDAATLKLGGLDFVGTIVSVKALHGRTRMRIAGGAGGWGHALRAKAYRNDIGVAVSTIMRDAAQELGETIEADTQAKVALRFARSAQLTGAQLMNHLVPRAWRVDLDGVTRLGPRSGDDVPESAFRSSERPELRTVTYVTHDPAADGLTPGATIDGAQVADWQYDLTPNGVRVTAWLALETSQTNRRVDALRRLVESLIPNAQYLVPHEFRVLSQTGSKLTVQPVRTARGMPQIDQVFVRPGMAGLDAEHTTGALVLVQFIEGDPSRPVITSHDEPGADGWHPSTLMLEADLVDVTGPTELSDTLGVAGDVALEANCDVTGDLTAGTVMSGNGASPLTREDLVASQFTSLKAAISAGFAAIGAGLAANGAVGQAAFEGAAASIPGAMGASTASAD